MAACALATTAVAAPKARSDAAQIRTLEDRFAAAVRAKDVDAIMRVYSPADGLTVFDVVPPRQYAGMDAYRQDWRTVFSGTVGPVDFRVSGLAIEASGGMAYSHSIQTMTWKGDKGDAHSLVVRVTDVYRKLGGAWRIVHEHVSVPVDLATGQGDLASAP
jgi:uncharacterized protein (TIGR02246 family)